MSTCQIFHDVDTDTRKASKPQLVHTQSKQSVTASDDYYSLESDQSNEDVTRQYQTPPSHMRSPKASQEMLSSEVTIPTIRPVRQEAQPNITQRPPGVHFRATHTVKRKPVSSEGIITQRTKQAPQSPPTPGVDDTPYIRFAIDQLTRDEEVVGPRQPEAVNEVSSTERTTQNNGPVSDWQDNRSSRHDRHSSDTVIRHINQPCEFPISDLGEHCLTA